MSGTEQTLNSTPASTETAAQRIAHRTEQPKMKYATLNTTQGLETEYLLGDDEPLKIPRGDVTVFFGDGSVGKGRLLAWVIKRVTSEGGSVIVVLPEDHPNEQVRPRLEAAGLTEDELSRVINLTRLPGSGRFKLSADTTHPGDLPLLREQILPELADQGHKVKLIVLDPLAALVGWGSVQSNAGARRAVEPLQDLAMDTGLTVALVAHSTKSGVLQGSAGLMQAVRLAYRVSKDRNNPEIRTITVEKGNNLPAQEALRFELVDDGQGNARVQFLTNELVEERQTAWRRTVYTAAMVITGRDERTEQRKLGKFTDLGEALATCAAQPELAGPALEWTQHVSNGVTDLHTISAGVIRFKGTERETTYAFAVRSSKPLTAAMAA